MLWLGALCAVLAAAVLALLLKVALLRRAAGEIQRELAERLEQDTNTLITLSTHDRSMRRLADSLNQQLRRLRQARQRFQSGDRELKEAVAGISHDLRTPLTAICGYLDLLQAEEKSADAARYLAVIADRAQAMTQLTEELFRYSVTAAAPDRLCPEDTDLAAALEQSLAAGYAVLSARGIAPVVTLPAAKVVRRVDRAALARVFGNLIGNAAKYSAGDLRVTLSAAGEVVFANTAPGLTAVQAEKLFDRFYTVETARNATGLGLAISRTLVEQMGGEMAARWQGGVLYISLRFPAGETR